MVDKNVATPRLKILRTSLIKSPSGKDCGLKNSSLAACTRLFHVSRISFPTSLVEVRKILNIVVVALDKAPLIAPSLKMDSNSLKRTLMRSQIDLNASPIWLIKILKLKL